MTDQVAETPFTEEPAAQAAPAPVADQQPVAQPAFQVPEVAQELVGEGKKYSSPEDALKALPHAQQHIETLEREMAELREQLVKSKTAEEILEEINKKPTEQVAEPQFDPNQLDELIESKLTAKEQQAVQQKNVSDVVNTFVQEYGDKAKAEEIYVQKAADLGISVDQINSLAAKSPKAVYELFGLSSKPESAPQKIQSNINSEAVTNNAPAQEAPKSVMGRSTANDDVAAWRASAPTE
jgi:hypothetical protein